MMDFSQIALNVVAFAFLLAFISTSTYALYVFTLKLLTKYETKGKQRNLPK